jgi:hypothetical protein
MKNSAHKRFGAIAVEKGFLTTEQLLDALRVQAEENINEGRHRLIGQILVERKYLTESQVEEVLAVINHQAEYMLSMAR